MTDDTHTDQGMKVAGYTSGLFSWENRGCKNTEVCYNWGHMITREKKAEAMAKLARTKEDVGSPEVQVSILTERIKEVTEHVKTNKHDYMAKRGLMQMVGQRKKLLKYLERTNFDLYKKTIAELGLRK